MLDWHAIGAGFAFYLIFEGLMPFLNPRGFKNAMAVILSAEEKNLRIFGAVLIVCGVFLLYGLK